MSPTPDPSSAPRMTAAAAPTPAATPDPALAAEPALLLAPLLALVPALRVLVGLLITALVIAALYLGRDLLIPIALAGLLGFLLDPAVTRLKRWGLPRALAVALVALATLGALIGAGTYLTSQLRGLSADLPAYQDTIRSKISSLRRDLGGPSAWDGAVTTFDSVQKQIERGSGQPPVRQVQVVSASPGPVGMALQRLQRVGGPAATAGIVALFVILILLDRDSLRDRMLRLMGGGNLHLATDALHEATTRIGRYLRMQLIVNASYGVPMAVGLYFIGVPGAVLWGALATVMRFVPYVGPMVSALFPLALAFAVDPGWQMVLWTLGLIAVLELVSNNIIEPWLYGASTGLSTLSIIIAATFWTTLWGPIGLILSTPLTVCLLVLGRYVPALGFIEALLGTTPVLAPPQRLYQRLLAGDVEEAQEVAEDFIEAQLPAQAGGQDTADALTAFYDQLGLPALRLASSQHADTATAHHRLRLAAGMQSLLEELREDHPAPAPDGKPPRVLCIGARWEIDAFAAAMAAHALALHGWDAQALAAPLQPGNAALGALPLRGDETVCLSLFHPQPQAQLRQLQRRLQRHHPQVRVIALPWAAEERSPSDTDVSVLAGSAQSIGQLQLLLETLHGRQARASSAGREREARRLAALDASGALQPQHHALYAQTARQAANAFDARYAQVSWIGEERVFAPGAMLPAAAASEGLPRAGTICAHMVEQDGPLLIDDLFADPRATALPLVQLQGLRFYAGVPLRHAGQVIGSLCVIDDTPRSLSEAEQALLEKMARTLMAAVTGETR